MPDGIEHPPVAATILSFAVPHVGRCGCATVAQRLRAGDCPNSCVLHQSQRHPIGRGKVTAATGHGRGLAYAAAMPDFALGLAALGRPAYINLGRDRALPADRSVEQMRQACVSVLDAAYTAGVRRVDVARSYGLAESFLADWLASRRHDDVTVSSKWGYAYVAGWRRDVDIHEVKEHTLEQFERQWTTSHGLLGDRIDLYQVHSLTVDSPLWTDGALLDSLARLRDRGTRLGFSTSGPRQAESIRMGLSLTRAGSRLFDAVQATWNALERSAGEALEQTHAEGLRVMVKEALANGRLAVAPPASIAELAAAHGVGADAVALALVAAQPWVDLVILGAASCGQLQSNLEAGRLAIPADAFGEIAEDAQTYWKHRSSLGWR